MKVLKEGFFLLKKFQNSLKVLSHSLIKASISEIFLELWEKVVYFFKNLPIFHYISVSYVIYANNAQKLFFFPFFLSLSQFKNPKLDFIGFFHVIFFNFSSCSKWITIPMSLSFYFPDYWSLVVVFKQFSLMFFF